jgi:chloride channel 7
MAVASGVAIPGGLFMPSIMVGAGWGALYGSVLRRVLPASWGVQPGIYALMAGAGVLGGVFRSTISLVALVLEGTRGVEFLGGVIMSVVVANWVAHHVHQDGVYESELERIGNLYFLRDEPPHRLGALTAGDVMATGLRGFRPVESVSEVLRVLRATTHNGFPVWQVEDGGEGGKEEEEGARSPGVAVGAVRAGAGLLATATVAAAAATAAASAAVSPPSPSPTPPSSHHHPPGRLEGLVLRSQLLVLLQRRQFCDARGRPVGRPQGEDPRAREAELETEMRTFFQRYFTHNRYVSATSAPLDALQLDDGVVWEGAAGGGGGGGGGGGSPPPSQAAGAATPANPLAGLYLDLRPYMNRSPFTVRRDCSAARAHQAFVGLGLRHLLVVDGSTAAACGVITRKDLDHAAGHGWWRMSAVAPKPHRAAAGTLGGSRGGHGGGGDATGGGRALVGAAAAAGRAVGQRGGDLLRKVVNAGRAGGSGGGAGPSSSSRAPRDDPAARLLGDVAGAGGGSSSGPASPMPPRPLPPPGPPHGSGGGGGNQGAVL